MIKYLKYDHIDKEKWDDCVDNSFNGVIYAYSWFLDVVCEEWEGLVEDDYERVFPINFKNKMGVNIVFQPFFTQQLGVISQTELSPAVVNAFLNAIPAKYRVVDLNLNVHNKPDLSAYTFSPQVNHELDLIGDYESIRKNYAQNTKRNLKKAESAGLSITKGVKPDEVIHLFRDNRGKDVKVLKEISYLKLKRLIYTCIYKGKGQVYGVYTADNILCAAAVFFESNKKTVFIFSGLSQEGREKRAMFFLIDNFIRENANKHLTLDFDGSNDEALSRFYKGFGSTRINFVRVSRNTLPLLIKVSFRLYRRIRSAK
ncbi:MAG: hypothetical protein ABFS05_13080 [Bacteroidota bacterium]